MKEELAALATAWPNPELVIERPALCWKCCPRRIECDGPGNGRKYITPYQPGAQATGLSEIRWHASPG